MAIPTASDNVFPKVIMEEVADNGSATVTPAADHRAVFLGEDGFLHAKDSAGAVTDPYDVSGGANVGNLWTMNKSASQTLTSATLTQITFDTTVIDGGGSVIDLVNDQFVAPATGLYLVICTWLWEATSPGASAHISVKVDGTESIALIRVSGAASNTGLNGSGPLSLTLGDLVTMWCHPGGAVTPTARGNAAVQIATAFTLVRIT